MPCSVETPPGTLSGFPVAYIFSEEGSELDTPFAKGLIADLDAALMERFLHIHISVAERKAVVGLRVGHGESVSPDPVKATRP